MRILRKQPLCFTIDAKELTTANLTAEYYAQKHGLLKGSDESIQLKEEEIFKKAKQLAKDISKVKKDAIVGTPTYTRLQKLWLSLDAYLVDYVEAKAKPNSMNYEG